MCQAINQQLVDQMEERLKKAFPGGDCEITDGTHVLARASIKAFQPEDFGEFLRQAAA